MKRVATIGVFDGVHSGHRHLLRQVISEATKREGTSMVVTFDSHPREIVAGDIVLLLTPDEEKTMLIRQVGIDEVSTLHFTPELSNMSAREFMSTILRDMLHVDVLVIGYDHRFGKNRADGFADYVRYGQELGMEVVQAEAYMQEGLPVSSSRIRQCLTQGKINEANDMLEHKYTLRGKVIEGYQRGRMLGFPTANIVLHPNKFIPRDGVYATQVNTDYGSAIGMLNIGTNPTFGNCNRTIEVHLLDFNHNLYNQTISVELHGYIREEIHFDNPSDLASQIHADIQKVRQIFDTTTNHSH